MRMMDCPHCNGAGIVTKRHRSRNPELETEEVCPRCFGEGEVEDENADEGDEDE